MSYNLDVFKNLYTFLRSFNKLRSKPLLDIRSYEQVLWLHEIPKEKECDSIIQDINSENINSENIKFDTWIKIKKPKKTSHPKLPEELEPWIKEGVLEQFNQEPKLFNYIIQESNNNDNSHESESEYIDSDKFQESENNNIISNNSQEEESNKVFLKDCPHIEKSFENYKQHKWKPWSQEEKRLESVIKVYNSIYNIYKKNKDQNEVYQIVLGLGFLSAKNAKGEKINRHIVTAPLDINFYPGTGTIEVKPCEQSVELSLEMDMFKDTEKPKNCDELNARLSNLNNDFWINEEFHTCLKSWINSYDPNGQFFNDFSKLSCDKSPTLTISPALILRKRNKKIFSTFYKSVVENIEIANNIEQRLCLLDLVENSSNDTESPPSEKKSLQSFKDEKHYFPLPANEEQRKIIKKLSYNHQVVVQGPPGTGKTHSIANLICHFLATGQKILVTSQTDRALKVLRDKIPKKVQPLCIEILGKDQKSFQDLKDSFSMINLKYQDLPEDKIMTKKIDDCERKDDELKSKLEKIKNQLHDIKQHETKKYENLFRFYTGTPAVISSRLKEEEQKYIWIRSFFDSEKSETECPISKGEAMEFVRNMKNLKHIDDAVLNESVDFLDQIHTHQKFEEEISKEHELQKIIEKYASLNQEIIFQYSKLEENIICQLYDMISLLDSKIKNLSNRNGDWIDQSLKDCLSDDDRKWRYLHDSTNKMLSDENMFQRADEISVTTYDKKHDIDISRILTMFFINYKSNDRIPWQWYKWKPKLIKRLKKIKINRKNISSYKEVVILRDYISVQTFVQRLKKLWKDYDVNITNNFNYMKYYHIFKDLCEPLEECLSIYDTIKSVEKILSKKNISQSKWAENSIEEVKKVLEKIQAKNSLKKIKSRFEASVSILKRYENQKNSLARELISCYEKRDLMSYKEVLNKADDFKTDKASFSKVCQIKDQLNSDLLYETLKKNIDDPEWEKRLNFFEEAWEWQRADQWVRTVKVEESIKQLQAEKKTVLRNQQKNMENLISTKAWNHCLSKITDEELSNLKGWISSIDKIGQGTGKTAEKHRREAKKRMEKCKTAIPAWIMPLYRVVENIKPSSKIFDVAIIDEASQTGPDGFLLNYLAKKIIIVGDKEQISPENPGIVDEDVEILKKKYLSGIKFFGYIGREYSYYEYCEILFTTSHVQLREHFRCMPEIIDFSNKIAYSGTPLVPLRQYGSSRLPPLKTTFVPDAISKIGDSPKQPQNEKEAHAIVDEMKKCIQDPKYKEKTFGIIVLQGKAQIQEIEKALAKIDKGEIEKRAIRVGDAYSFQGDERDVIFLSMAIAQDWNKSTLTRATYKKIYNVASSRAKDQMWLFHSVELNDLSPKDFRRQLLSHCQAPSSSLSYPSEDLKTLYEQIKETPNKNPSNAPEPFDSWFEARVFYKIASKGYNILPQYRVGNYSIDMIIIGSNGRLAVECDGDYWHTGQEQEQQDEDRQWQLERCGWTFWRLPESIFNRNEDEALKSLWKKLDQMTIYPL